MITLDDFFLNHAPARVLYDAVLVVVNSMGGSDIHVTKSQIAFRRKKAFAWVWIPGMYLRGKSAPLVLTLSFRSRNPSPRWKEVVEPYPGRFTHHLELYAPEDVDEEVRVWLREAWLAAG